MWFKESSLQGGTKAEETKTNKSRNVWTVF